MYILKKYILQIATIFILFLSPFSLTFNTDKQITDNIALSPIEFSVNSAYALSVPCKGGFFNFLDNTACGIGNVILTYFELIWFYTTQILAVLAGLMLDFFLFFSIDSQFYRSGMIEAGWEILRNFTNVLFIFALLLSAFKMVLGDGSNAKKKLIQTILIALVVNFSLFVSYAVIDMSNVFAHVFYNKIEGGKAQDYNAGNQTDNSTSQNSLGDDGQNISPTGDINENVGGNQIVNLTEQFLGAIGADVRSVSLGVMSNINPQKIVSNTQGITFGQAYITVIMAGLMNLLLIYLFLSISILFVGRTLGLMMLAIMSPLAFASILIPGLENNKYIGLKNWFSQLFSLAFTAPIFIFFMYLVVTFITNKGILASLNSGNSTFFGRIMSVYMLFFMIGGMLLFAKKITTSMAGEIGGMFGKVVAGATGAIVGVTAVAVTGGAALAGGAASGVGRLASGVGKLGKSKVGSRLGLGGKWTNKAITQGDKARVVGRRMMSLKADVTNIPMFKTLVGKEASGMIGKVTGRSALGHLEKNRKDRKKNSVFGDEYGKIESDLEKEKEQDALKDAKNKAKKDRAKAENEHEAELYQAKMKAQQEKEKLNEESQKDGYKDHEENIDKQSKKQTQLLEDSNKIATDGQKSQEKVQKEIQGLKEEINSVPANLAGMNSTTQKENSENDAKRKELNIKLEQAENQFTKTKDETKTKIENIQNDIKASKDSQTESINYISEIEKPHKEAEANATEIAKTKKIKGDLAEEKSRAKSAEKHANNPALANKINKGISPKSGAENKMEKLLKKLEEDE